MIASLSTIPRCRAVSYPNGFEPVDSLFLRHAATALRSREIVFQDFYRTNIPIVYF